MSHKIPPVLVAAGLALTAGLAFVVAAGPVALAQDAQGIAPGPNADALRPFGPGGGNGNGFRGNGRGGGNGGGGGRGQPIVLDAAQLNALKSLYVPPASMPVPADNRSTEAKLALGKRLFFDPALSGNGKIACASCHDARHGFADPQPLSIGVKGAPLARRTQPVVNLAWATKFFWDGRAPSLEAQAVMPIDNVDEMGMPHPVMTTQLQADVGYRRMFAAAFPGEVIGPATVGKALAVFERTLNVMDTPFDRWVAGDETAISDQAKRGFVEFNTRGGCAQCHSGWNFTDGAFNDIGLGGGDLGRSLIAPGEERHGFKTPSLRNVANRAPYMHTGNLSSLNQVLRHYRRPAVDRSSISPKMSNVRVARGNDIVAFLQTLSSPPDPELVKLQEELERRTGVRGATPVQASQPAPGPGAAPQPAAAPGPARTVAAL